MFSSKSIESQSGNVLVEMTALIIIAISFVGAALDLGAAYFVAHTVQTATREGARIAATVPLTTENTREIIYSIQHVIDQTPFVHGRANITSTTPFRATADADIEDCDRVITVTTQASVSPFFLPVIGVTSIPIERSSTMRFERQGLCF